MIDLGLKKIIEDGKIAHANATAAATQRCVDLITKRSWLANKVRDVAKQGRHTLCIYQCDVDYGIDLQTLAKVIDTVDGIHANYVTANTAEYINVWWS